MTTEEIRARYRPDVIKVLFVGESPPRSGTFFYNSNSNLYRCWKKAFERALHWQFTTDEAFLSWLKERGFFLDDLLLAPKPKDIGRKEEELLWRTGIEPLLIASADASRRSWLRSSRSRRRASARL